MLVISYVPVLSLSFSLWSPFSSLSPSSVAQTHSLIPERHEWSKKMQERGWDDREGGREGGRKGFQGAAGLRSTQTDAVEQRWQEQKEQQKVRMCMSVCVRAGGGEGGQIVNTTSMQCGRRGKEGGVKGWVGGYSEGLGFFLERKAFVIKATTEPQNKLVLVGVQAVGGSSHLRFDETPKQVHVLSTLLPPRVHLHTTIFLFCMITYNYGMQPHSHMHTEYQHF